MWSATGLRQVVLARLLVMFVVAARFHFLHQLLVFRSVLHQSLILLGR